MPTRPVESTHDEVRHSSTAPSRASAEAEPNHPVQKENTPGVESPSGDRMQGAPGLPHRSSPEDSGAEAGDMHASPDPSSAGPRESLPGDKVTSTTTNEDDATSGDQDIDTAGTAHDDLSPTKSM